MKGKKEIWQSYIRRQEQKPKPVELSRDELRRQVDEYLANGGRVQEIPLGMSGEAMTELTDRQKGRIKSLGDHGGARNAREIRLPGSRE
jgi:hypothetical protein